MPPAGSSGVKKPAKEKRGDTRVKTKSEQRRAFIQEKRADAPRASYVISPDDGGDDPDFEDNLDEYFELQCIEVANGAHKVESVTVEMKNGGARYLFPDDSDDPDAENQDESFEASMEGLVCEIDEIESVTVTLKKGKRVDYDDTGRPGLC